MKRGAKRLQREAKAREETASARLCCDSVLNRTRRELQGKETLDGRPARSAG